MVGAPIGQAEGLDDEEAREAVQPVDEGVDLVVVAGDGKRGRYGHDARRGLARAGGGGRAGGEGVAAVADAGAKPLNWVRDTPEVSARPLNWLSNDDSSASMSVGLWTLGIWVAIFSSRRSSW